MYPEYTGTALTAILKQKVGGDKAEVYQQVKSQYEARLGLTLGPPFGFNNTFAMEIRGEDARRLNLKTLSQAAAFAPHWRAGFGYEFMERPTDTPGWLLPTACILPAHPASWISVCLPRH